MTPPRHDDLNDHDLLIRIDERTTQLTDYILGSSHHKGLADRVRSLERWRWIIYGAGSVLLGVFEYLVHGKAR